MEGLLDLNLEQLLNVSVKAASGVEEHLRDAPAAMLVISAEEIRQRGYTSLDELFADLPGFDAIQANGTQHLIAYQRGYRTPFMQRTLFMINGVVDNHLWTHSAQISRQYPLTAIKQVEVLYGPTSAVYGANAFLGIINLITHDPADLKDGEHFGDLRLSAGSYQSRDLELSARGRQGAWQYRLAGKAFRSDEAGLDDYASWGFLDAAQYQDRQTWGAILDQSHQDVAYGDYYDPTDDWGLLGELRYKNFRFGLIAWDIREGYGPFYAADRVQPNTYWKRASRQYYLDHETQWKPELKVKTRLLYRESRLWGNWVEAVPDWAAGMADYSYLSLSNWNSQNRSWLLQQDYDYRWSDKLRLTGGLKYERKTLTKAYDLCSYWSGTYCSSDLPGEGPYDLGDGVFHSSDPVAVITPDTLGTMPDDNLARLHDIGAYLQASWQQDKWRWQAGLRYDRNSMYGSSLNPRLSAIYYQSDKTTLKLLYGRAFQEPSPLQLWGGWIGRAGNPDLRPETAQNLELILMQQGENWLHDISLFAADYRDVIKEEAENAGTRQIFGLEYRGRFHYPNPFFKAPDISGYLYYSYTHARSSITYQQALQTWIDEDSELGDIAPHKINFGLNLPINPQWQVNLRANYVSQRLLYSRNPLRESGRKAPDYIVAHLALNYRQGPFSLGFKIKNLFNESYYQPGLEQADAGDDFTQRSLGFRNSLIPQEKRSFWLSIGWRWE